jgi:methylated-DNA-protein-cysteine methyltransferase-like protein
MPHAYADAVHALAALVPPGRVLSYGDVAELLGRGGPRQVGAAMSSAPADLPWWRILRADGTLPQALAARAAARWDGEGTPRRGARLDMAAARWQPDDAGFAAIDSLAEALHAEVPAPAPAPLPQPRRPRHS